MSKKIDKNGIVQRYLDKTNCSHWRKEDEDNNNINEDETTIGLPSLEFLHEIQKSISYKLAKKYKYIANNNNNNENDEESEEFEEVEPNEQKEQEEEEEEEKQQEEDNEEEEIKDRKNKVKKTKTKSITRSVNSGKLKMNTYDSINRFPLSEPCFKAEYYNERCGPEILMSLGVLHQQILISSIKSLNSFQKTNKNKKKK